MHDTIVNQLLTKIDGVDALNNILLIGMTNRCALMCIEAWGKRLRHRAEQVVHTCPFDFCLIASSVHTFYACALTSTLQSSFAFTLFQPCLCMCRHCVPVLCRKDMLDEALLRPGRLEVQVEIGLPDERGRVQILQVQCRMVLYSTVWHSTLWCGFNVVVAVVAVLRWCEPAWGCTLCGSGVALQECPPAFPACCVVGSCFVVPKCRSIYPKCCAWLAFKVAHTSWLCCAVHSTLLRSRASASSCAGARASYLLKPRPPRSSADPHQQDGSKQFPRCRRGPG